MSECFTLKGGMVAATTLNIETVCVDAISEKMKKISEEAPALIKSMPILLDFNSLGVEHDDVKKIIESVRETGAIPFALKGSQHLKTFTETMGLSYLGESGKNKKKASQKSEEPVAEEPVSYTQEPLPVVPKTLVIESPVRTGQVIQALDSDVVILSSVSPGAEIVAGGSIHVYGRLHGKALAGCSYSEDARIFCHELDAELISISGDYMLKDSIQQIHDGGPCQIRKIDGTLTVKKISI